MISTLARPFRIQPRFSRSFIQSTTTFFSTSALQKQAQHHGNPEHQNTTNPFHPSSWDSIESYLNLTEESLSTYVNVSPLHLAYRGRGLFGGTLAAQSTLASILHANSTSSTNANSDDTIKPKKWKPISTHCVFLHPAKPHPHKLTYKVETLKTGKNYCTKEVQLIQDERLIFKATVTLQAYELAGSAANMDGQLNHHSDGPHLNVDILPPEKCLDQETAFRIWSNSNQVKKHHKLRYGDESEWNVIDEAKKVIEAYGKEPFMWKFPQQFFDLDQVQQSEKEIPVHDRTVRYWVKSKSGLKDPDVYSWAALAYVSDYFYLSANMRLNLRPMFTTKFSVSLDHTIYFNQQINVSDWFSYNVKNLKAGENRSIMFGEIFDQEGTLAATTIQEGLSVVHHH
ncbi:unnamed protein product [Ambrosiozyma monospora]|uniref:Unnamed protein product n=1 Tax=Ambrosiozyma monospora TaxID=43982 RepID=A0A9W7DCF6_AMBMO|nr:unnamed protein product [Ambrosiozyma monospora]